MQPNETRTLWISIGAAIFAVILLYGWAQEKRANLARTFGQTKTVVIALKDIPEMDIIDQSKLEVVERPAEFVQPGAIQDPDEIIGQIALAPIAKGEQVLNTKLVFPDKSTGLSMQVAPGKRAISLPVTEVSGVAKLIKPGDRVDVIGAVDDGKGKDRVRKLRTILLDIPVLAVGQSIVDNLPIRVNQGSDGDFEIRNLRVQNDYKTLTIEVSPAQAQNMMYLQSLNLPFYFSLRNPNDRAKGIPKTSDLNNVLSRARKKKKAQNKKKLASPTKQDKKPTPQPKPKRKGRFETL